MFASLPGTKGSNRSVKQCPDAFLHAVYTHFNQVEYKPWQWAMYLMAGSQR
jgi:hypothetical protein